MAERQNAPRKRGASRSKGESNRQRTRAFDPRHCGPHCGSCWETFCGDERCCLVLAARTARKDLTDALAGGGEDG